MREIELKFQVPAARREAVRRALQGRAGAALPVLALQAAYFDTADRALAAARLAIRLRREDGRWVQTLKGAPVDGLVRAEHDVPLDGAEAEAQALPTLRPQRHAGTPVGEALLARLAMLPPDALQCRFRTDIRRTVKRLRVPGGLVEIAFDEGELVAGEARAPVCELEFELKAGTPALLVRTAARWAARHRLVLDTRTKAERGDLLARGLPSSPPRFAQPVALQPGLRWAQARRAVMAEAFEQIAVNASTVATGRFDDEHVHQLRVGLRRLRSGLRLFEEAHAASTDVAASHATTEPLAEGAAALFRALGAARDVAAIAAPLQAALDDAMASVGLQLPPLRWPADTGAVEPAQAVGAPAAQAWLLALLGAVHAEPALPVDDGAEPPLRRRLARRLRRWQRGVAQPAASFASIGDAERHALRKRAKRLRYGLEFAAALFAPKRLRRLLKPLKALQERLGALNDTAVALEALGRLPPADPAASFARGWLAARRQQQIGEAAQALRRLAEAPRRWGRARPGRSAAD